MARYHALTHFSVLRRDPWRNTTRGATAAPQHTGANTQEKHNEDSREEPAEPADPAEPAERLDDIVAATWPQNGRIRTANQEASQNPDIRKTTKKDTTAIEPHHQTATK